MYDVIFAKLHAPKKTHRGWQAQCPAHEDSTPSLSVRFGNQGQLLLFCFAGCQLEAIVAALGVTVKDLFPEQAMELREVHEEALRMIRAQQRRVSAHQGEVDDSWCWEVIRRGRALATKLGDTDVAWELLDECAALETMMLNA